MAQASSKLAVTPPTVELLCLEYILPWLRLQSQALMYVKDDVPLEFMLTPGANEDDVMHEYTIRTYEVFAKMKKEAPDDFEKWVQKLDPRAGSDTTGGGNQGKKRRTSVASSVVEPKEKKSKKQPLRTLASWEPTKGFKTAYYKKRFEKDENQLAEKPLGPKDVVTLSNRSVHDIEVAKSLCLIEVAKLLKEMMQDMIDQGVHTEDAAVAEAEALFNATSLDIAIAPVSLKLCRQFQYLICGVKQEKFLQRCPLCVEVVDGRPKMYDDLTKHMEEKHVKKIPFEFKKACRLDECRVCGTVFYSEESKRTHLFTSNASNCPVYLSYYYLKTRFPRLKEDQFVEVLDKMMKDAMVTRCTGENRPCEHLGEGVSIFSPNPDFDKTMYGEDWQSYSLSEYSKEYVKKEGGLKYCNEIRYFKDLFAEEEKDLKLKDDRLGGAISCTLILDPVVYFKQIVDWPVKTLEYLSKVSPHVIPDGAKVTDLKPLALRETIEYFEAIDQKLADKLRTLFNKDQKGEMEVGGEAMQQQIEKENGELVEVVKQKLEDVIKQRTEQKPEGNEK